MGRNMTRAKLVRDKIPDIIRNEGREPVTRIATDEEYRRKLKEKLQEEVAEYLESGSAEEIADVLEVIDALVASTGLTMDDVAAIKKKKFEERGGFAKKIILEGS